MGFKDVRASAIKALEDGNIHHEARGGCIDEKNLLQVGDVTPQQVSRLLKACRGDQYECSPHHHVPSVAVHIFRPIASLVPNGMLERWYIKLYMLSEDCWFISVHRSHTESPS